MKIRNAIFAWPRWVPQTTTFVLLVVWLVAPGVGQHAELEISPGNEQLVDKEPFDRVFLDKKNKFATLDILPLERIPTTFPDRGTLVFELSGNDEFKLELPWVSIVDYKSFEDLLLEDQFQLYLEV